MLCSMFNSAQTFFNSLAQSNVKKEPAIKESEVKAYGVNPWSRNTVVLTFSGARDHNRGSNYEQFNFYDTFEEAKNNAFLLKGRGPKKRNGFVFEFGYTEYQVKRLADKGQFSATIIAAYNSYELSFDHVEKTQRIINPKFDPNRLQESLSLPEEDAPSPSKRSASIAY